MNTSHLKLSHIVSIFGAILLTTSIFLVFFVNKNHTNDSLLAAGKIVQVTVDPSSKGALIPPSFVGISTEPGSNPCNILALDRQNPILAENIFKNLGPGILRLGGDSVENVSWSPTGTYACSDAHTVQTQSLVNDTMVFLRKVGWKVIWGLSLKNGDPNADADEAAYIHSVGGSTLLSIELGNEPNGYGWPFNTYQSKWETFSHAIKARDPNVPILGPANIGCCQDWFTPFVNAESSQINIAAEHWYPTVAGNGDTIKNLLSPGVMQQTISHISPHIALAKSKNLLYQIDESNAVANIPSDSVGAAFGISLWALDYLFTAAEHGADGVNIHGFSGDATSIFNRDGSPRPIYYGMIAFHYAAPEGTLIPVNVTANINVTAHAVVGSNGNLKLILINKDESKSTEAQINATRSYSHATAIRLSAPSVNATSGITLGGKPIDLDGNWSPSTVEQVNISGANSQINLPPGSVAIITYSNGGAV